MRLTNTASRALYLPGGTSAEGERVRGAALAPGESVDVPLWYVEEVLLEERGPAERLSRGEIELDEDADAGAAPELPATLPAPAPAPASAEVEDLETMGRDELRAFARERELDVDLRLGEDNLRAAVRAALDGRG